MFGKLAVIIALVGCVIASHPGDHLYSAPSTLSTAPLSTSYGVPIQSTSYLEPPVYSAPSTTTNVQTVHYSKPVVKTVVDAVPVTTYQYVQKNVVSQEPATAQITYQVPSVQSEKYYYVPLNNAKVVYLNKASTGSYGSVGSVSNVASSSLSYSNLGGLSSVSSTGLSSGLSGLSYSNLGGSSLSSVGTLGSSSLYGAGSTGGLSYSNLGGSGLSYSNLGGSGLSYSNLGNSGW